MPAEYIFEILLSTIVHESKYIFWYLKIAVLFYYQNNMNYLFQLPRGTIYIICIPKQSFVLIYLGSATFCIILKVIYST